MIKFYGGLVSACMFVCVVVCSISEWSSWTLNLWVFLFSYMYDVGVMKLCQKPETMHKFEVFI